VERQEDILDHTTHKKYEEKAVVMDPGKLKSGNFSFVKKENTYSIILK
jgi:hypothetical protein